MVATLIRIHDVNRLVAALEPVLNERKQHAILFVVAIEKCADVTHFPELGAGQGNRCCGLPHAILRRSTRQVRRQIFLCESAPLPIIPTMRMAVYAAGIAAGAGRSLAAIFTRSARESAFIFCITLPRCAFTVISLIPSSPPTCLFSRPETTNAITCRSRWVSDA